MYSAQIQPGNVRFDWLTGPDPQAAGPDLPQLGDQQAADGEESELGGDHAGHQAGPPSPQPGGPGDCESVRAEQLEESEENCCGAAVHPVEGDRDRGQEHEDKLSRPPH